MEYATEAVKQGAAVIGLGLKTHVVLASANKTTLLGSRLSMRASIIHTVCVVAHRWSPRSSTSQQFSGLSQSKTSLETLKIFLICKLCPVFIIRTFRLLGLPLPRFELQALDQVEEEVNALADCCDKIAKALNNCNATTGDIISTTERLKQELENTT
ncbi:hypothetical protein CASFOL_022127 [Castilleja foliolosa]|uniref:Conserved oligomeric Golgi complex subunit 6 n=1 Tax=Castilleja foliolosa TaxID=1961234 RepID=A0ABD3CZC5_9LAMI